MNQNNTTNNHYTLLGLMGVAALTRRPGESYLSAFVRIAFFYGLILFAVWLFFVVIAGIGIIGFKYLVATTPEHMGVHPIQRILAPDLYRRTLEYNQKHNETVYVPTIREEQEMRRRQQIEQQSGPPPVPVTQPNEESVDPRPSFLGGLLRLVGLIGGVSWLVRKFRRPVRPV